MMSRDEMLERLKGIIVAIITPVNKDESPDVEGIRRVTRYVIDSGVSGILVLGSTGEFAGFNEKERILILETIKQEAGDKMILLGGISGASTKECLMKAKEVKECGLDGVAATAPYYYLYNGYEEEMLDRHFAAIMERIGLPTFLYDLPMLTKVNVSLKALERLAKYELFYGVKDSSRDFSCFQKRLHEFGEKFILVQGDERQVGVSVLMGADGALLGIANVIPEICVELYQAAKKKDMPQVQALQKRVTYICDTLLHSFMPTSYSAYKAFFEIRGLCRRYVTSPFLPATDKEKEEVANWLKEEKLI